MKPETHEHNPEIKKILEENEKIKKQQIDCAVSNGFEGDIAKLINFLFGEMAEEDILLIKRESLKATLKGILISQEKEVEFLEKLKLGLKRKGDSWTFKTLLSTEKRINQLTESNKDLQEKIK